MSSQVRGSRRPVRIDARLSSVELLEAVMSAKEAGRRFVFVLPGEGVAS